MTSRCSRVRLGLFFPELDGSLARWCGIAEFRDAAFTCPDSQRRCSLQSERLTTERLDGNFWLVLDPV